MLVYIRENFPALSTATKVVQGSIGEPIVTEKT